MKKLPAIAMAAMLATPAIGAAPQAAGILHVNGKPVPVSCLQTLANGDSSRLNPIDLQHCGDPSLKPKTDKDGMVGFDDPQGGYFYYRDLGQSNGMDIIFIENSGGGSGQFTSLTGVNADGHTLRVAREIAGGDRCNTGIANAALANGHLTFDQAITPYDLIDMANINVKVAVDALEGSAASCIGVRHMTGDDKHWTSVELTEKNWTDQKGWTETIFYQSCFNKLYRETVAAGHTKLDKNGLAMFGRSFVERCVGDKS